MRTARAKGECGVKKAKSITFQKKRTKHSIVILNAVYFCKDYQIRRLEAITNISMRIQCCIQIEIKIHTQSKAYAHMWHRQFYFDKIRIIKM